ncbi:Secondary metabolism regulator LAE1 [Colletotrichum higginsianum]|uniref:Secondary metabolism regulator LAE1 n=1 Tax=Colletotrichum higginsianum TaxID=80884 RepID=A0A4V4N9W7_9PEZI|nr:Secondary metabolism regulator LAE1 [Colletotrichum higginsianum]
MAEVSHPAGSPQHSPAPAERRGSPESTPAPTSVEENALPPAEPLPTLTSELESGLQIEVDAADASDVDSALDVPTRDSLTSLRSSLRQYQHENGRTYHAMSAGKYFLPNDESEVDRLDLQHYVMTLTLGGNHCLCPKNRGAKRVLDLGTGTGIWSVEYADAHPEAEVIGVDLSPVQPDLVPPNCSFELDDLEKDWTWSRPFDFIFCRMMTGSFSDNMSIVQKVFDALEPGGYFEAQDMALPLGCDDGTLTVDSDLWKWVLLVMEGMEKFGRPVSAAQQWKQLMEAVGFVDVVETIYKWPTNRWPRDQHYKELGMWSLENMDQALEPATLAPLTRALGWTYEEVIVLVSKARKVMRDPTVHAYWPIFIVHGRKPGSPK